MEKCNNSDEISKLKREISKLKQELLKEKQKKSLFGANTKRRSLKLGKNDDLWDYKINSVSVYSESSYVKTVIAFVKSSTFYRLWIGFLTFFRRFRMLTYISAFISYALALIGTGALLLVYLSATALFFIASALFFLTLLALASSDIKKSNKLLSDYLINKDLYVFFASGNRALSQKSFFFQNALEFSNIQNSSVLIVTPSLFSRIKSRRFLALRKERENLFIIRKYYYFSFKKRVLPKLSGNITVIF